MKNKELVEELSSLGYHISFAESCTGGLLAATIIDIANASMVLNESFITYSNDAKIQYLEVSKNTIETYGVVSEDVAREMVIGLCKKTHSECGVSVTGIAGPSGGTKEKPVGMVCFGFKVLDFVCTKTMFFGEIGRNNVRLKCVEYSIREMLNLLKK